MNATTNPARFATRIRAARDHGHTIIVFSTDFGDRFVLDAIEDLAGATLGSTDRFGYWVSDTNRTLHLVHLSESTTHMSAADLNNHRAAIRDFGAAMRRGRRHGILTGGSIIAGRYPRR